MRRNRKLISILLTMAMLATLLVPLAAPAAAATVNRVSTVPSIADDAANTAVGSITLKEDDEFPNDIQNLQTFTITFPKGVKLPTALAPNFVEINPGGVWGNLATVTKSGDYTVDVTISGLGAGDATIVNSIRINPVITIDGFDGGDIVVTIDEMDSAITGGDFVVGRVAASGTSASVISVEDIGEIGQGGTIRITENSINALGATQQNITLKLPSNFEWDQTEYGNPLVDPPALYGREGISFMSGLAGTLQPVAPAAEVTFSADGRTMTINFLPVARAQRGIIQIETYITANSSADFGEVEVSIAGTEVDDEDLVVANDVDFGVLVEADGDVEDIFVGENGVDIDAAIHIEELVADSIFLNRKTTIEFPSWVDISAVAVTGANAGTTVVASAPDDNEVDITCTALNASGAEFDLEFDLSLKGNASGDIVAELSGRSGIEGEVTIGKAVSRITVSADPADIKVGVRDQAIGDITITETDGEAIMDGAGAQLTVTLPDGVMWSEEPTVTVEEGNLEIDEDDVDVNNEVLTIPVDSSSTKASKIVISDIKVDLDRTIPEGPVTAEFGGTALITAANDLLFDQDWAVKELVARVATPAPGEVASKASFTIGSTSYILNGVETTMDVAPYIKADRTYMPIRFVAYALGLNDSNILWDAATQKVTLIKGDKVVQLTIGSKTLLVNGAAITMDVAPEIASDRTMLPIRHVAEVLGADVGWDPVTQLVTIN